MPDKYVSNEAIRKEIGPKLDGLLDLDRYDPMKLQQVVEFATAKLKSKLRACNLCVPTGICPADFGGTAEEHAAYEALDPWYICVVLDRVEARLRHDCRLNTRKLDAAWDQLCASLEEGCELPPQDAAVGAKEEADTGWCMVTCDTTKRGCGCSKAKIFSKTGCGCR